MCVTLKQKVEIVSDVSSLLEMIRKISNKLKALLGSQPRANTPGNMTVLNVNSRRYFIDK